MLCLEIARRSRSAAIRLGQAPGVPYAAWGYAVRIDTELDTGHHAVIQNQRWAMHYEVSAMWAGWWGGYGSDNAIAEHIEAHTPDGWRMASVKVSLRLWLWLIPRPRLLFIYERPD